MDLMTNRKEPIEILIAVEDSGKIWFYANMFSFINNNENKLILDPNYIIEITDDLIKNKHKEIEVKTVSGELKKINLYNKVLMREWELMLGNDINGDHFTHFLKI